MVDWTKIKQKAKDVGSKTKDVSVKVGKQAGIGLSDEEKDALHKKKLKDLQMKAEMEEAKLARQSANNELRARIAESKKKFNENKPESGFSKLKKTLDTMKDTANADKARHAAKKSTKTKSKPQGMNFEQMLGMGGASGGNFNDMLGGLKSNSKSVKKKKQKL